MTFKRLFQNLPAYAVNGITVAAGIGFVQLVVGSWGGLAAAFAASSGAIYASLADLPNLPERAWRRVLSAALLGVLSAALVMVLRPYPVALGVVTGLLGFALAMALVWGPRAGPHAFVGILALVFTMAAPEIRDPLKILEQVGLTALGAALYFGWAMLSSFVLQKRYRQLALVEAIAAASVLLRTVANEIATEHQGGDTPDDATRQAESLTRLLRSLIRHETALAERLQIARDFIFAARDSEQTRRQTGTLLRLIDLRDTLLASQLDVGLLGKDLASEQTRAALAAHFVAMAGLLDETEQALRFDSPLSSQEVRRSGVGLDALRTLNENEAGSRLLTVLYRRACHISDDIAQLRAGLRGEADITPVSPDELRMFVSPETWPLAALRANLHFASPIFRHAVRVGLALACAYFIALHLPWTSHPHWLVLSVAVVLRGNLEQTLSRRNMRVLGTALGCLLTAVLMQLHWPWFSTLAFLVAAGVAHSFVNVRYLVTATAATTMALLQIHLPELGVSIAMAERLADTVLGAALAWGFSYVLPHWERRILPLALTRAKNSLLALGEEVMRWPETTSPELSMRLARREAYDALNALAAIAQRTGAEPRHVQLSIVKLAALLAEGRQLLAHFASTRLLLTRRAHDLDRSEVQPMLESSVDELRSSLAVPHAATAADMLMSSPAGADEAGDIPEQPIGEAVLPWLRRRLEHCVLTARRFAQQASQM